ncbi:MAG: matrixin family metalloprotease [Vicinamibacterales bacterium]
MIVTSDGLIFLPDGPNGELSARATDTWGSQWTGPTSGVPVQGLDGGGLLALVDNGLAEFSADGTVAAVYPTDVANPLFVLRDQEMLHGVSSAGEIEAVSVSKALAGVWSFLKNIFSSCLDTKLNAVVLPTQHIGILPKATPYTYRFVDDPAHPWLTRVASGGVDEFQKRGVRDGFNEWHKASVAKGLGYQFIEISSGQADFEIVKVDFQAMPDPEDNRPVGTSGEFKYWGYPVPPSDRRITGGTILIADDSTFVYDTKGYRKVAMHELGHAFGLAHPWAPFPKPPKDFRQVIGGTLMNNMLADPDAENPLRDDAGGRLPNRPTECDIRMVRLASTTSSY